jgi:hypothetical protein
MLQLLGQFVYIENATKKVMVLSITDTILKASCDTRNNTKALKGIEFARAEQCV